MPSYSAGRLRLFEQRVCDGNRSMRFSCLGSIEGCPTLGAVMPAPWWAIVGGMPHARRIQFWGATAAREPMNAAFTASVGHDLVPEWPQGDWDHLEVGHAEWDANDGDAEQSAGEGVANREPDARQDEPQDIADA